MTQTIGPNLLLNEGGNRLTQVLVAKLPVFRLIMFDSLPVCPLSLPGR
jgi:hypothetical protein